MTSSTTSRVARVGLVFVAIACVLSVAAGAAVAQEENETTTPTPEGESENEVVAQVDSDLTVVSYHYNRSTAEFVITLENDMPRGEKPVTIAEAVSRSSDEGGSSSFGIRVVDVEGGERATVRMKLLGDADDPGVMITTPESINNGRGTQLWAEKQNTGGGGIIRGPATWPDVGMTALMGGGIAFLGFGLGAWQKVSDEAHGAEEVDLDE